MFENQKNKPSTIAEVGSNWSTFDDCMRSISLAKACGADAVKFQAYSHEALYGKAAGNYDAGNGMGYSIAELKGTLPLEWLPKLKDKAHAFNIEFMCSAFSPELLDAVNPHVNIHKLA